MREEIRYFTADQEAPFVIELTGYSWCDGSYRIIRRNSPIWVMEQVTKGTGTIYVDGKRYTASEGDVYLLPRGADHVYCSDARNPWEKWFFNVRGEICSSLIEAYGLSQQVVFPNCKMDSLFRDFYEAACEDEDEAKIFDACALQFHTICMEISKISANRNPTPDAAIMKAYLDRNIHKFVTAEELAKLIYRSKDHALKLFKRVYGQTPYTYLLQKKIEVSKRLLKNTALPVCLIAARLGYEDPHYFTDLFKRFVGQTPTAYRKSME